MGRVTFKKQFVPSVIEAKESSGNDVSEEQLNHAALKFVPLDVSINGNDVSDEQLSHAKLKIAPLDVSINGNDVRDEQFRHALKKFVTPPLLGRSLAVICKLEHPL